MVRKINNRKNTNRRLKEELNSKTLKKIEYMSIQCIDAFEELEKITNKLNEIYDTYFDEDNPASELNDAEYDVIIKKVEKATTDIHSAFITLKNMEL